MENAVELYGVDLQNVPEEGIGAMFLIAPGGKVEVTEVMNGGWIPQTIVRNVDGVRTTEKHDLADKPLTQGG
jgi:hypothetical protein